MLDISKIHVIERENIQSLLNTLVARGYRPFGPIVQEGAISVGELASVDDLPIGLTDSQEPGKYRLEKRDDEALFGYAVGEASWKEYLFPHEQVLWRARRSGSDFEVFPQEEKVEKPAFIGVRPCDLKAIEIHKTIFGTGDYKEPGYLERLKNSFIVAVNCTSPGGNCFCASMGTGPKAAGRFDLALTELIEGGRHYFVVEIGSELGAEVLAEAPASEAKEAEIEAAESLLEQAEGNMGRELETEGLKETLYRNFDNPEWERIAERCLTCANCTMVCPTCFCSSVEDSTDLTGKFAQRTRHWAWCFTVDYSYIHGGSIRATSSSRYRQWLTHKFATWVDQFGMFGCVGCGRCITWCPVGIDVTAEVERVRANDLAAEPAK